MAIVLPRIQAKYVSVSPFRQRVAGGARSAMLWAVDSAGKVQAIRVRPGVSDGQKTAVQGEGLREGMTVIIGLNAGQAAQAAGGANPLMPQRPGGRGF